MKIEELTTGLSITIIAHVQDEQVEFQSSIEEVLTKKKALLASLIYQNEKIITFRGKNISVDLLVSFIDGSKPHLFKDINIALVQKSDGTYLYYITCEEESKAVNRRGSFRCYIGLASSIQSDLNRTSYPAVIKDVSSTGFSLVCSEDITLRNEQVVHVLLSDYIAELNEEFTFHLYGIVVRAIPMDKGRVVYGCRLNSTVPGLDQYIMKKERVRLRNTSGVNL
jgi:hypothetical protein